MYVMKPWSVSPTNPDTAAMLAACQPSEWVRVEDDGTWSGPYPDCTTALAR